MGYRHGPKAWGYRHAPRGSNRLRSQLSNWCVSHALAHVCTHVHTHVGTHTPERVPSLVQSEPLFGSETSTGTDTPFFLAQPLLPKPTRAPTHLSPARPLLLNHLSPTSPSGRLRARRLRRCRRRCRKRRDWHRVRHTGRRATAPILEPTVCRLWKPGLSTRFSLSV